MSGPQIDLETVCSVATSPYSKSANMAWKQSGNIHALYEKMFMSPNVELLHTPSFTKTSKDSRWYTGRKDTIIEGFSKTLEHTLSRTLRVTRHIVRLGNATFESTHSKASILLVHIQPAHVSWLSQGSLIFVTIVSSREATEKSVDLRV